MADWSSDPIPRQRGEPGHETKVAQRKGPPSAAWRLAKGVRCEAVGILTILGLLRPLRILRNDLIRISVMRFRDWTMERPHFFYCTAVCCLSPKVDKRALWLELAASEGNGELRILLDVLPTFPRPLLPELVLYCYYLFWFLLFLPCCLESLLLPLLLTM